MAKITTGELYQEWKDINTKLLTQIDNQNEIIEKQQDLLDRFNEPLDTQVTGSNVKYKKETLNFSDVEPGKSESHKLDPPENKRWKIHYIGLDVLAGADAEGKNRVWIRYGSNHAYNQVLSIQAKNDGGRMVIQGNVVTNGEVKEGPKEETTQSMALGMLLSDETDLQIEVANNTDKDLRRANVVIVYEEAE